VVLGPERLLGQSSPLSSVKANCVKRARSSGGMTCCEALASTSRVSGSACRVLSSHSNPIDAIPWLMCEEYNKESASEGALAAEIAPDLALAYAIKDCASRLPAGPCS